MTIIRSFNPIGQGAFYTERFYEKTDCKHIIVFDCGVEYVDNKHIKYVQQAFSKNDRIDYLFISHLDEDHISLVTTLKKAVRFIENVVLPYIDIKDVVIMKMLAQSLGMNEVYAFWSDLYSEMEEPGRSETRYRFVVSEGQDRIGRNDIRSGQSLPFRNDPDPDWIFKPYYRHPERKDDLEKQLEELLKDTDFQKALKGIGVQISSVQELTNMISKAEFATLIGNEKIKTSLRSAYKALTGGINKNSLVLYSGPAKEETRYRCYSPGISGLDYFEGYDEPLFHHLFHYLYRKPACVYTGDSGLDMPGYSRDLGVLWYHVGTIQLPHHGSRSSFDFSHNIVSFTDSPFIFPVSCGEQNGYGHPSAEVLDYLRVHLCLPVVVTENRSTRYSQMIVRN